MPFSKIQMLESIAKRFKVESIYLQHFCVPNVMSDELLNLCCGHLFLYYVNLQANMCLYLYDCFKDFNRFQLRDTHQMVFLPGRLNFLSYSQRIFKNIPKHFKSLFSSSSSAFIMNKSVLLIAFLLPKSLQWMLSRIFSDKNFHTTKINLHIHIDSLYLCIRANHILFKQEARF